MKRLMAVVAGCVLVIALGNVALAGSGNGQAFHAKLDGYQEIPTISSSATGSLTLNLDSSGTSLAYSLTYTALQGGNAIAAHIHLGRPGIAGSVAAYLCGGGGKPACPARGGTMSGTIGAANVLAIPAQGLGAHDFAALLRTIRNQATYVNVDSVTFPGGEIRGEIIAGGEDVDDPISIAGSVSWYCRPGSSSCTDGYPPSGMYAAAGPRVRAMLGPTWLGRRVTVASGSRVVVVRLIDSCPCPGGRLLDLYSSAFAKLAPLSAGTVRVLLH
jgi:hypothetical protein